MTKEIVWIEPTALMALHNQIIEQTGGCQGIRDPSAFESALARPQNAHYYENCDSLAKLATKYAHGIARNHAFVDGNKRTAFVAMALFPEVNGHPFPVNADNAADKMVYLAEGSLSEDLFAKWVDSKINPEQAPKARRTQRLAQQALS